MQRRHVCSRRLRRATNLFASNALFGHATTSGMAYFGGRVGVMTAPSTSYGLTVAGAINIDQYSSYEQAGANVLYASTTRSSLFVGDSGNTSFTGASNIGIGASALSALTFGYYKRGCGVSIDVVCNFYGKQCSSWI